MWQKIKSWFSWRRQEKKIEPPSLIPDKKENPPNIAQTNTSSPFKNSEISLSQTALEKILEPIQDIADMDTETSVKSVIKSTISAGTKKILTECKDMSIEAFEAKYGKLTAQERKLVELGASYGTKMATKVIAEEATNKIIQEIIVHYGPEIFGESALFTTVGRLNQYVQAFMLGYSIGNKANYIAEKLTGESLSERIAVKMAESYVYHSETKFKEMNADKTGRKRREYQENIMVPIAGVGPWN